MFVVAQKPSRRECLSSFCSRDASFDRSSIALGLQRNSSSGFVYCECKVSVVKINNLHRTVFFNGYYKYLAAKSFTEKNCNENVIVSVGSKFLEITKIIPQQE